MPTPKVNAWYGWVPDRPDYRDKLYTAIAAPPKKLPPKVDLRAGCSRVEDQGQLGSCTANALVGNLEFLEMKAGHSVTNLSRLFVYYNERAMEGTINDDAGAMIRDGVKSLVKLGVCSERNGLTRLRSSPKNRRPRATSRRPIIRLPLIIASSVCIRCANASPNVTRSFSVSRFMRHSSPMKLPGPVNWTCLSRAKNNWAATPSWPWVMTSQPSVCLSATLGARTGA